MNAQLRTTISSTDLLPNQRLNVSCNASLPIDVMAIHGLDLKMKIFPTNASCILLVVTYLLVLAAMEEYVKMMDIQQQHEKPQQHQTPQQQQSHQQQHPQLKVS